jgi:chaperone modulatory protein CbpM
MDDDQLIATEKFCVFYNVGEPFIESLVSIGMIDTVIVSEVSYLRIPHLSRIERMIRLHDELDLNPEGIEIVHILLEKINGLNREVQALKNRISFYES